MTDADVEEQVARLRARFESNPQVQGTGVTFDQFLRQRLGIGEAELREDPSFRTRVALERMLSRDLPETEVRSHWEKNRDAYGDRALVRQVYVAAADRGGKGERIDGSVRSFADAHEIALRAKVAVLERSGQIPSAEGTKKTPLPEAVTCRCRALPRPLR